MFNVNSMRTDDIDLLIDVAAEELKVLGPTHADYAKIARHYSDLIKLRLDIQNADLAREKAVMDQDDREAQRVFNSEENVRTREAESEARQAERDFEEEKIAKQNDFEEEKIAKQNDFAAHENRLAREAEAAKDGRLKKGEIAAIAANLAGILLVLNFEQLNIITGKAFSLIRKV